MINNKPSLNYFSIVHCSLFIRLLFIVHCSLFIRLFSPSPTLAQSLSLSISPPLVELTIQPGRQVTFSYQLMNNSERDLTITPMIKSISPLGAEGLITLKDVPRDNPIGLTFESGERFNLPFLLSIGETKQMVLKIAPNSNAAEKDYYYSLLFSSGDLADKTGNQTGSITQIGSNLLITVSKDGQLNFTAKIEEFTVPKIVDSFDAVKTNLVLKNTGNVLFKPFGKIIFSGWFGQKKEISLLEQNVLSGSTRRFEVEKFHPKVPFGIFTTQIEFEPNQQAPPIYQSLVFYYFPIRLTLFLGGLFLLLKAVKHFKKTSFSKDISINK